MSSQYSVGFINTESDSGSLDAEGPKFIRCMDGPESYIHEVWNFGEDGVTREVHLIARVDVVAGFFGKFATNSRTGIWHRISMFGRISINGSV